MRCLILKRPQSTFDLPRDMRKPQLNIKARTSRCTQARNTKTYRMTTKAVLVICIALPLVIIINNCISSASTYHKFVHEVMNVLEFQRMPSSKVQGMCSKCTYECVPLQRNVLLKILSVLEYHIFICTSTHLSLHSEQHSLHVPRLHSLIDYPLVRTHDDCSCGTKRCGVRTQT